MVFTNYGIQQAITRLGSDVSKISYIAIGTGSSIKNVNTTTLTNETQRKIIESYDYTTPRKITVVSNFTTTEMSGTDLREFGSFDIVSLGSSWLIEGFPAVTFDGTNELTVDITIEGY